MVERDGNGRMAFVRQDYLHFFMMKRKSSYLGIRWYSNSFYYKYYLIDDHTLSLLGCKIVGPSFVPSSMFPIGKLFCSGIPTE